MRTLIDRELARQKLDVELEPGKPAGLEFRLSDHAFDFFNLFEYRAARAASASVEIEKVADAIDPAGPLGAWAKP